MRSGHICDAVRPWENSGIRFDFTIILNAEQSDTCGTLIKDGVCRLGSRMIRGGWRLQAAVLSQNLTRLAI